MCRGEPCAGQMTNPRFDVRLHKAAQKEYEKLDNSVVAIVDKALEELEKRADEVGKPLGKKHNANLTGCKEIKLREAGVRIVFTITNEYVHILQVVVVIAVEERAADYVFRLAQKRFAEIKNERRRKKKTK